MTSAVVSAETVGLQGHYAGAASRLVAFVLDVLTVAVLFTLAGQIVEFVWSTLLGRPFTLANHRFAATVALVVWTVLYFAYSMAAGGRTAGMAVVGLKVVRADGGDLDGTHALVRVLLMPFSFVLFGLGLLLILVNRDRRSLHDLVAGTVVVYAWDARAARLRFLAKDTPR